MKKYFSFQIWVKAHGDKEENYGINQCNFYPNCKMEIEIFNEKDISGFSFYNDYCGNSCCICM